MRRSALALALMLAEAVSAQPSNMPGSDPADESAGFGTRAEVDEGTDGRQAERTERIRRLLERRDAARPADDGATSAADRSEPDEDTAPTTDPVFGADTGVAADTEPAAAPIVPEPVGTVPDEPAGERVDAASTAPIGVAEEGASAAEIALREQRVLANTGEASFDLVLAYGSRVRPNLVALDETAVVGEFESESVTLGLLGRYALTREFELAASVLVGETRTTLAAGERRLASESEVIKPEVGLAARYALLEERAGRPNLLFGLDARLPGDADAAASAALGVTLTKTIDPLVLYGGARYRRRIGDAAADASREARGALELTVGQTFAVNDSVALGTTLDFVATTAERVDGVTYRARREARLTLGATARIARGLYLQPALTLPLGTGADGFGIELGIVLEPAQR